jgi:hypothetical protein
MAGLQEAGWARATEEMSVASTAGARYVRSEMSLRRAISRAATSDAGFSELASFELSSGGFSKCVSEPLTRERAVPS